jgi:hypothetical protein
MELPLRWQGPVGPGLFPEAGDDLAALAAPGVYLRIKRYDGDRTVSYVGRSNRLVVRFDQHLRDILTFSSALRNDTGSVALGREGANRFAVYNRLGDVMALVAAEAARMRFFWAACEDGFREAYLSLVEGALKSRLEAAAGGAFACENVQGIGGSGFDDDIVIAHDFDALDADGRELLTGLLGTDPIRLSARIAELGHAE